MELMPSNKTENLTETEQNEQQNVDFTPISIGKSGQLSEETLIIKLNNWFVIFSAIVITLSLTLLAVCGSFVTYFKIFLSLFGVISILLSFSSWDNLSKTFTSSMIFSKISEIFELFLSCNNSLNL